MPYEYPDALRETTSVSAWTISIHLVLLALVISPLAILLIRTRFPVRRIDGWLYLLAGFAVIIPLTITLSFIPETGRPFLIGYFLFFELVCFLGFTINLIRLYRSGTQTRLFPVLGLLVILGIIVGLLLPAVPSAREAARRMSCSNQLKQIGLVLHNYAFANHDQIIGTSQLSEAGHEVSWRIRFLPFLENQSIYDQYDDRFAWNSPENLPVAQTVASVYQCPSNPWRSDEITGNVYTSYSAVLGKEAFVQRDSQPDFRKRSLASSNQIWLVEACGQNIIWTEPRDVDSDQVESAINLPGHAPGFSDGLMSSLHVGGAHVAIADGSVGFLSSQIDPIVLRQLTEGVLEKFPE